jgi:hypothetical protein
MQTGENGAPEKSKIFWGKNLFGREGMGRKTQIKKGRGKIKKGD